MWIILNTGQARNLGEVLSIVADDKGVMVDRRLDHNIGIGETRIFSTNNFESARQIVFTIMNMMKRGEQFVYEDDILQEALAKKKA